MYIGQEITRLQYYLILFNCSYNVNDVITMFRESKCDYKFLIHHILTITGGLHSLVYYRYGCEFMWSMWIAESTAMFLNIMPYLLYNASYLLSTINNFMFIISFTYMRVFGLSWVVYTWCNQTVPPI